MTSQKEEWRRKEKDEINEKVELPLESSPYVKHDSIEDYKMAGYGAVGQEQPVDRGGGGGSDGPTLSGTGLPERMAQTINPPGRNSPRCGQV